MFCDKCHRHITLITHWFGGPQHNTPICFTPFMRIPTGNAPTAQMHAVAAVMAAGFSLLTRSTSGTYCGRYTIGDVTAHITYDTKTLIVRVHDETCESSAALVRYVMNSLLGLPCDADMVRDLSTEYYAAHETNYHMAFVLAALLIRRRMLYSINTTTSYRIHNVHLQELAWRADRISTSFNAYEGEIAQKMQLLHNQLVRI